MSVQSIPSVALMFAPVKLDDQRGPDMQAVAALRQDILNAMVTRETYFVQMSSVAKTRPYAVRIGQLGKHAVTFRAIGDVVEMLNERGCVLRAYRVGWTFEALRAVVETVYQAKRAGRLAARALEIEALSLKEAEKQLPGSGWTMTWSHAVQPMSRWHTFRFVRAEVAS